MEKMLKIDKNMHLLEILLTIISLGFVLYIGKDILIPIIFGIFIWYLINSIAVWYNKIINKKNNRILKFLSVVLGILTFLAIIAFIVEGIKANIDDVIKTAPQYQANFEKISGKFIAYFNLEQHVNISNVFKYLNFSSILSYILNGITAFLTNTGIVIGYVIFLFLEQTAFANKLNIVLDNSNKKQKWYSLITRIDDKMKKFLRIKTFLNLTSAGISYMVMQYVNLDFALFWAILIFIMGYIPTFGALFSSVFPMLIAFVQFDTIFPILVIAIGITSIQVLTGNILEPKLMGNVLNVSPMIIMISLVIWGSLWGFVGMFLGVPLIICTVIALSEIKSTRPIAIMMTNDGKI